MSGRQDLGTAWAGGGVCLWPAALAPLLGGIHSQREGLDHQALWEPWKVELLTEQVHAKRTLLWRTLSALPTVLASQNKSNPGLREPLHRGGVYKLSNCWLKSCTPRSRTPQAFSPTPKPLSKPEPQTSQSTGKVRSSDLKENLEPQHLCSKSINLLRTFLTQSQRWGMEKRGGMQEVFAVPELTFTASQGARKCQSWQQLLSAENLGFPNLGHRLVEFTLNRASLTLYLSPVLFQLRISAP